VCRESGCVVEGERCKGSNVVRSTVLTTISRNQDRASQQGVKGELCLVEFDGAVSCECNVEVAVEYRRGAVFTALTDARSSFVGVGLDPPLSRMQQRSSPRPGGKESHVV